MNNQEKYKNNLLITENSGYQLVSLNNLDNKFSKMSDKKIKEKFREKNGQLTYEAQKEMSLRNSVFLMFLRKLHRMPLSEINELFAAYKKEYQYQSLETENINFLDMNLLLDALHYYIALKNDCFFDIQVVEIIKKSYFKTLQLLKSKEIARDYLITDKHMLKLIAKVRRKANNSKGE
jgi:glutamate formiminotransferase